MVRKILKVTDPLLRRKSKPVKKVDKKTLAIIADLKDTLKVQKDPEGVGLAAPQIGKLRQIFVMRYGGEPKVIINPEIISSSSGSTKKREGGKKIMEGCLSLPHYYGPLLRPDKVKAKYLNEKGDTVTETFYGFEAQIIQHEVDHLVGILFVDRLLEQKKPLFELVDDEWQEVEI